MEIATHRRQRCVANGERWRGTAKGEKVHWFNGRLRRIALKGTMDQHRHCKCGAIYRRTESMAPAREVNSFECSHCGETLESWNSAWVPSYRLVIGPIVKS